MASFFGLFNYEKEGPGVSKNEPQKRGIFAFFDTYFRYFWHFITANIWLVLLSLPLVTAGLGSVGMTYVSRSIARGQHSFGTSDFFESIKKNWKQGLGAGIINLLLTAAVVLSSVFYFEAMTGAKRTLSIETVCFGLLLFILLIFTMMKYYIWTLMITFSFKMGEIYRNSFRLAFIGLWRNLKVIGSLLLFYIVGFVLVYYCGRIGRAVTGVIGVCIFPAFRYYLIQCNVFPVIKKFMIDPYYAQHPGEDIEKRRKLGLELAEGEIDTENENVGDNENVFTDTSVPSQDSKGNKKNQ